LSPPAWSSIIDRTQNPKLEIRNNIKIQKEENYTAGSAGDRGAPNANRMGSRTSVAVSRIARSSRCAEVLRFGTLAHPVALGLELGILNLFRVSSFELL
jgi:hypothetical protein